MPSSVQRTLFALDCGATNWRLYRVEYRLNEGSAQVLGEPQPASLTSFVDRRLPAVICLDPEGAMLESFGEVAQQQLEDERNRERVREYFKPCIGSHLYDNPLPSQKRYTHHQALLYTKLLLEEVLVQIRQEKCRGEVFDERVVFTLAYPVHWRYDHDGKVFEDFKQMVQASFGGSLDQIRFVAEPEGAILSLRHNGLLGSQGSEKVTLIIDVGGSTTDVVAGRVSTKTGELQYIGRYGEPFGGGLYDAELAKYIADHLNISASALADDPSALVSLRVFGQRLKESLSRQMLHTNQITQPPQRTITLVMRDGTVFRRAVILEEAKFRSLTQHLNDTFENLVESALRTMSLPEAEVGQVVLVGGGAQLFTIIGYLRQRFGDQKVVLADNSEEIVVQGIGLEYGASFGRSEPIIDFSAGAPGAGAVKPDHAVSLSGSWGLFCEDNTIIPLPAGTIKIGRDETNDIVVEDMKASRYHAEMRVEEGRLIILDLGSTNGTYVNGQRLIAHQVRELHGQDVISIGRKKYICKP